MSDSERSDTESADLSGDPSEPYRAPSEVAGSRVKAGGLASPGCWIFILVVAGFMTLGVAAATYTATFGMRRGPRNPQNFRQEIENFGGKRNGPEEPFYDEPEAPMTTGSAAGVDVPAGSESSSGSKQDTIEGASEPD